MEMISSILKEARWVKKSALHGFTNDGDSFDFVFEEKPKSEITQIIKDLEDGEAVEVVSERHGKRMIKLSDIEFVSFLLGPDQNTLIGKSKEQYVLTALKRFNR